MKPSEALCDEFDFEPMIYTESVDGWSEGVKEAVCEPDSDFYLEFLADVGMPLSIDVTDAVPPRVVLSWNRWGEELIKQLSRAGRP